MIRSMYNIDGKNDRAVAVRATAPLRVFSCFVLTTDGRTSRAGEGDGDAGVCVSLIDSVDDAGRRRIHCVRARSDAR